MESLAKEKGDFRLRIIDVKDWDSPVAKAHKIRSLPTLKLYQGTKLVSSDTQEVFGILQR